MSDLFSESDSNIFAIEECHLSYHSFSLTSDILFRVFQSQNPRVPEAQVEAAQRSKFGQSVIGVRVRYFLLLAICQFPFVSSRWLL